MGQRLLKSARHPIQANFLLWLFLDKLWKFEDWLQIARKIHSGTIAMWGKDLAICALCLHSLVSSGFLTEVDLPAGLPFLKQRNLEWDPPHMEHSHLKWHNGPMAANWDVPATAGEWKDPDNFCAMMNCNYTCVALEVQPTSGHKASLQQISLS